MRVAAGARLGIYPSPRRDTHAQESGPGVSPLDQKKFTEPVALSSTTPANFRLPPTVARCSFDLPALRARCKGQSRAPWQARQVIRKRKKSQIARTLFIHDFHSNHASLWKLCGRLFTDRRGPPAYRPLRRSRARSRPTASGARRESGPPRRRGSRFARARSPAARGRRSRPSRAWRG